MDLLAGLWNILLIYILGGFLQYLQKNFYKYSLFSSFEGGRSRKPESMSYLMRLATNHRGFFNKEKSIVPNANLIFLSIGMVLPCLMRININ